MSTLGLNKLAWDLEHVAGLGQDYDADPESVLNRYDIDPREVRAVVDLDATTLLRYGMNPVALRNLLVLLGIPHAQLYTHAGSPSTEANSGS